MHTGKIQKPGNTIYSRVCMEHASPKPAMQVQCAQMIVPFHSAAIQGLVSGLATRDYPGVERSCCKLL